MHDCVNVANCFPKKQTILHSNQCKGDCFPPKVKVIVGSVCVCPFLLLKAVILSCSWGHCILYSLHAFFFVIVCGFRGVSFLLVSFL